MVSKKQNTSAFPLHALVAVLLATFASFGSEGSGRYPCFASEDQGQSATGELVIVPLVQRPSSCPNSTIRIDSVPNASKPKRCAVANIIQVIDACENLRCQAPVQRVSPLTISAKVPAAMRVSSVDAVRHKESINRFVTALRFRAKQRKLPSLKSSETSLDSLLSRSEKDASLPNTDPQAIFIADPVGVDTPDFLKTEEIAVTSVGMVVGPEEETPTNQKFVSSLMDLAGEQEREHTGEQIRYVAAEELLSTPVPTELPSGPKVQSQQVQELLGPTIFNNDWVSTSSDVDTTIINDLSADVRPKLRGKLDSKNGDQIYTEVIPENFAAQSQGVFESSPLVGVGARRFETGNLVLWAAPKFRHRPLYFEEPNLERYGHSVGGQCIQSAVSTAHFFGSIPLLPYKMGANPPNSCNYTLGRFRPGNCNPRVVEIPEFSPRGFLYQGLFTTGAAFVVP